MDIVMKSLIINSDTDLVPASELLRVVAEVLDTPNYEKNSIDGNGKFIVKVKVIGISFILGFQEYQDSIEFIFFKSSSSLNEQT